MLFTLKLPRRKTCKKINKTFTRKSAALIRLSGVTMSLKKKVKNYS